MTMRTRAVAVLLGWMVIPLLSGCCPEPCEDCPPVEVVKEAGTTIHLVRDCTVEPGDVHLSRSPDKINHVRWHNQTSEQQTVRFDAAGWPFLQAHADIVVEAGKYSIWYTVDEMGQTGLPLNYKVDPLISPSCPPDEPAITTDP